MDFILNMFRYNLPLRVMHWLVGIIIIGMLASGFYMKFFMINSDLKWQVYKIHKQFGATVGVLLIIRIIVRWFSIIPVHNIEDNIFKIFFRFAANATHSSLYICMFLMVISGYIMSDAGGHDILWFNDIKLFSFFIKKKLQISSFFNQVHLYTAYITVAFITLHILGVLKHIFIDKYNILKRII